MIGDGPVSERDDATARAGEARAKPELSIIIAVYNEEDAAPQLLQQLHKVLGEIGRSFEIIMVNDGSTDRTAERIKAAIGTVPHLRVVELYRNYGQVAALGAGMSLARGEWLAMMDGDLQHDPADLRRLMAEIERGHDLIATYRAERQETPMRLLITWVGNRVNRYLTGAQIRDFGSAYRVFSARLLDVLTDSRGYVYYNTPALYMSARSFIELPITQYRRPYGSSKWSPLAFILYNLDFLIHSKKVPQILLSIAFLGVFIGIAIYLLSSLGYAEPARAISAPVTIAFTSFLVMLLAVIWRELMQTQRFAQGHVPFLVAGVWRDAGDGVPSREEAPRLRSGRVVS